MTGKRGKELTTDGIGGGSRMSKDKTWIKKK